MRTHLRTTFGLVLAAAVVAGCAGNTPPPEEEKWMMIKACGTMASADADAMASIHRYTTAPSDKTQANAQMWLDDRVIKMHEATGLAPEDMRDAFAEVERLASENATLPDNPAPVADYEAAVADLEADCHARGAGFRTFNRDTNKIETY